jgi:lysyl-tRNA synthetase class 2
VEIHRDGDRGFGVGRVRQERPRYTQKVETHYEASPILSQFESQFEENLYQLRREKLQQIVALGQEAYPNTFGFTHTLTKSAEDIPALLPLGLDAEGSPKSAEVLEAEHIEVSVAGRIVAIRLQGKAGFATLQQNGARIQIYVRKDDVGEQAFELYKLLDLGDHIGVHGTLIRTRTGELTLKALPLDGKLPLTFLAKAMLPLPDKYAGLGDIELRYRRRYLDLFTDTGDFADQPEGEAAAGPLIQTRAAARDVFVKRAHILRAIRKFFDERGYLEVETPMLHTIAGGAAARPFTTHHNALDIPLNLRIAPELYLKRLVVGGLDRVYEINRNFRNEGVSTQHNPEFTMLEFYQAYANYHDLMDLTQELVTYVAKEVNGTTLTNFNGTEIDLSKWTKVSMRDGIAKFWPDSLLPKPTSEIFASRDTFAAFLKAVHEQGKYLADKLEKEPNSLTGDEFHGITIYTTSWWLFNMLEGGAPYGKIISDLFEIVAEKHLIQPTIIYDFPLAVSPLSKVKPDEPDWVERFEFYIGGFEVGNAFSELNDPDDQLRRFEAQLEERKRGDDEAMAEVDEDYVRALGYGLPPTAGEGIGIDRLTMILTGSRSIRDVILFPLMRPQKAVPEQEDEAHGESAE